MYKMDTIVWVWIYIIFFPSYDQKGDIYSTFNT